MGLARIIYPPEIRSAALVIGAPEIFSLFSAPVVLVAAPGAGFVRNFYWINFWRRFATRRLTVSSNTLRLGYNAASMANTFVELNFTADRFLSSPAYADQSLADVEGLPFLIGAGADIAGGAVALSSLGAGGLAYAIGDTGFITTGDGTAAYVVGTVDGLGAVLTFSISAGGNDYVVGNGQATAPGGAQPGIGNGAFTIDVDSILQSDSDVVITGLYSTERVP